MALAFCNANNLLDLTVTYYFIMLFAVFLSVLFASLRISESTSNYLESLYIANNKILLYLISILISISVCWIFLYGSNKYSPGLLVVLSSMLFVFFKKNIVDETIIINKRNTRKVRLFYWFLLGYLFNSITILLIRNLASKNQGQLFFIWGCLLYSLFNLVCIKKGSLFKIIPVIIIISSVPILYKTPFFLIVFLIFFLFISLYFRKFVYFMIRRDIHNNYFDFLTKLKKIGIAWVIVFFLSSYFDFAEFVGKIIIEKCNK